MNILVFFLIHNHTVSVPVSGTAPVIGSFFYLPKSSMGDNFYESENFKHDPLVNPLKYSDWPKGDKVEFLPSYEQSRDRSVIIYDLNTDPCVKISPHSTLEAKDAANTACTEAFNALDETDGNSCHGWRNAACRQVSDTAQYLQCSCLIPYCDAHEIKRNHVMSFRDCAWKICAEELLSYQTPVPSARFQHKQQEIHDEAVEKAFIQQVFLTQNEPTTPYAGATYSGPSTSYAGGAFSGSVRSQVGSMSSGSVGIPVSASTSYSAGSGVSTAPVPAGPRAGGKLYACDLCGRLYASPKTMKSHRDTHEREFRCTICNKPYSNKGNYNYHMRTQHPVTAIDPKTGFAVNPIIVQKTPVLHDCEVCGASFERATSLAAHKKTHAPAPRCQLCDAPFVNKATLTAHNKNFHPEIVEAETAKAKALEEMTKKVVCPTCGQRFTAKKRLQEHMPVHRGETYCEPCERTFPRKSALSRHNKNVHNLK